MHLKDKQRHARRRHLDRTSWRDWEWEVVVFQFLCERMEVAKYSSREQVEVFVSMLQKSLTINVGKPHNIMSRHVTAVGTRFRYTH